MSWEGAREPPGPQHQKGRCVALTSSTPDGTFESERGRSRPGVSRRGFLVAVSALIASCDVLAVYRVQQRSEQHADRH